MSKLPNPIARDITTFSNPIDLTGFVKDKHLDKFIEYLSKMKQNGCIIVLILP
jgi:pentatricopeptide repeat protein